MGRAGYLPSFLPARFRERVDKFLKTKVRAFRDAVMFFWLLRKSHAIKIHWDHPSPGNPEQKCLVTKDLSKEFEYEALYASLCEEFLDATQRTLAHSVQQPNSQGTEVYFKASHESAKPLCLVRMNKASGIVELRDFTHQWKLMYKLWKEPLQVEAWGEWINVPGYYHAGIVREKQVFLDRLLQSLHPDLKPSSATLVEDYSPSRPWASCIVSEPLDAFADFDALWSHLLELLKAPQNVQSVKLQNVTPDSFTVFAKGSGNRSSWSWTKYRHDKNKLEEGPKVVGPAVELTVGEVEAEHYSAWRELQYRSHVVLHRRPLRLEFWGETLSGTGPRMKDPYPVLFFGLMTIFGKIYEKEALAAKDAEGAAEPRSSTGYCSRCRRRGPATKDKAE